MMDTRTKLEVIYKDVLSDVQDLLDRIEQIPLQFDQSVQTAVGGLIEQVQSTATKAEISAEKLNTSFARVATLSEHVKALAAIATVIKTSADKITQEAASVSKNSVTAASAAAKATQEMNAAREALNKATARLVEQAEAVETAESSDSMTKLIVVVLVCLVVGFMAGHFVR